MKQSRLILLFFLFILVPVLFCSKINKVDQKEYEPIDLNQINPAKLPYRLEIVKVLGSMPDHDILSADLDGDGVDELVIVSKSHVAPDAPAYVQAEGIFPRQAIFRENFQNTISAPSVLDIDNDGKKEIIISELKNDTTKIWILNHQGKRIKSFTGATDPKIIKDDVWYCTLDAFGLMDVNNDGYKDILFKVGTTFAYQPRGIFAYDLHRMEYSWKYQCGFQPRTPHLIDINGDGKREILLGSSSPENYDGIIINGTDDVHVYLTVLDSLGKKINQQNICSKFSHVILFIHDMNKDGNSEIIIVYNSGETPKENSYVALWDPLTGKIAPKISMEKTIYPSLTFTDADKDGYDDVLIGWSDGTLEFRNHKLKLIRSKKFINFIPSNLAALDLNNDGEKELAVTGRFEGSGRLLIFNSKLDLLTLEEEVLGFNIDQGSVVSPGFGREKLFIAGNGYKTVLLRMKKQFLTVPSFYWSWLGRGFLIGMLLTGIFITILTKRSHENKLSKTLHSLISSVPEGILVLNSTGKIVTLNRAMEQFLNVSAQNIIGLSYKNVFSDSTMKDIKKMIDSSYAKNLPVLEKEIILLLDGSTLNFLVEAVPFSLKNQKRAARLIIIRNITDIVQSKRTIAWGTMAQKLAHEIKTPLSTVMLSAQRLQMEYEQKPKEMKKVAKYLNNITGQVDRLRKVTDAFMKFVKMEKLKIEPIHINQLLLKCFKDMQIKMSTKIKIKKELATDIPTFKADGQQLSIALNNIFDNSLNAMKDKGTITVTTRLVQSLQSHSETKLKNSIQIEIADTGKGITKDHMNQLFQPFFSKSPGGTGLGLVITKKIIEDHEGEIKIVSEEGIGTTVFVTLPCEI